MIATVVTFGGIGRLPGAPGTFASAAAVPLAWLLHWAGGFVLVIGATIAVTAIGWWATEQYIDGRDDDPGEVVIDEVAGMMVALWPLSVGMTVMGAAPYLWPWPGWVLGFLLFRALDILKPPPVSWAERAPGATGVMLDDLVAGGLTALAAMLAAGVAHGWI
ncbi:MAG: phosphatidylglycerophosphatase A [Pseudomonadota bacterium]